MRIVVRFLQKSKIHLVMENEMLQIESLFLKA